MSDCLVSVIVPAFNVEKYVEKCINSLISQDYKNIEILIIDDGSSDNTASILDSLAGNDNRIRISHVSNAGVSAARNLGIQKSQGKYIVFVDADDYLAKDFVSYMLSIVERTKSPFCLSKNCFVKKGENQILDDEIEQITSEDAVALLLSPYVVVGCWNKIYERDFLIKNNIRFSENLFYGEGLSFIIECAQKSIFVGIGNKKVYFYRKNNEISATTSFNIEKIYNGEKSINDIEKTLRVHSEKISAMCLLHRSMFYAGAVVRLRKNQLFKVYKSDYKNWISFIRKNYFQIFVNKYIPLYRKFLLLGVCGCPSFINLLDIVRRNRNRVNSI